MKQIINGRKYDTETAEYIASTGFGYSGDFRYWSEDLYKTEKGNWFIAGEGGPLTRYAVSTGDGTSGSERIIPLSKQEVLEWLESANKPEILEKFFPDDIEEA